QRTEVPGTVSLGKMKPEAVIGCCLGRRFQNSSENGTRDKSLRLGKGRTVDFELGQDLIRIFTSRRDSFEQSRSSRNSNNRSCHHSFQSQPFHFLQLSAALAYQVPVSCVMICGALASQCQICIRPLGRLPGNLTAFDMRFDMASKSFERSPSTVDKLSACQLIRRPAICRCNSLSASLTVLFKPNSFLCVSNRATRARFRRSFIKVEIVFP